VPRPVATTASEREPAAFISVGSTFLSRRMLLLVSRERDYTYIQYLAPVFHPSRSPERSKYQPGQIDRSRGRLMPSR